MIERIPQSVAMRVAFKVFLSSDHVTAGGTSLTIPVQVSKNGAGFANLATPANAVSVGSGWYYIDLAAADVDTLGPLVVRGTEGTIDPAELEFRVVKATNAGFSSAPDAAAGAKGGLPVLDAGTGLILTGFGAGAVSAVVGGYATNQGPLFLLTGGVYPLIVDNMGQVTFNNAAAPTAQQVWEYATRTLTAFAFTVNINSNADIAAILADTNELQTLWTTGGPLDLLLKDVPNTSEFNARTLVAADYFVVTDYTAPPTAQNIWEYGTRVLTASTNIAGMTVANVTVGGYASGQSPVTLLATALTTIAHMDMMLVADGGVWQLTANALELAPNSTGGDATAANQTTIITHLTDMKGTAFVKDTNSLVDLVTANQFTAGIAGIGGAVGSGSLAVTITTTVGGAPVEGAAVWITSDEPGTTVVAGTLYSDTLGVCDFMLDPGTYYVWRQHNTANFTNPQRIVVS